MHTGWGQDIRDQIYLPLYHLVFRATGRSKHAMTAVLRAEYNRDEEPTLGAKYASSHKQVN